MSRANICDVCGHRMTKVGEDLYFCQYCHDHGLDSDYVDDDDEDDEAIDAEDAALIWLSHGCDEDYTFGYSEDELKNSL